MIVASTSETHKGIPMKAISTALVLCRARVTTCLFKRHERYSQEVLSHAFICLPLPYTEGIVLICNMDLNCVIAIFKDHRRNVQYVTFVVFRGNMAFL